MSKKKNTCEKIAETLLQQEEQQDGDFYKNSMVQFNSTSPSTEVTGAATEITEIQAIPLAFSGKNRAHVNLKLMLRNDKSFLENAMKTVGRSFAGTIEADPEPFAHWFFGPKLSQLDFHYNQYENVDIEGAKEMEISDRQKISQIALGFHIGLSGIYPKQSFVIGARIHNDHVKNDLPQDGLVIARYYPNGPVKNMCETSCWPICLAIREQKLIGSDYSKSPFKDHWPKIEKRLQMGFDIFYNWKKKWFGKNNNTAIGNNGKSLPFIYIAANAVLPECQGKGVGSRQMKMISAIADKLNIHCWLECGGEKNIAIYKRLGYKVVEKVDALHMVDDPEDWVLHYVGMMRDRKSDRVISS